VALEEKVYIDFSLGPGENPLSGGGVWSAVSGFGTLLNNGSRVREENYSLGLAKYVGRTFQNDQYVEISGCSNLYGIMLRWSDTSGYLIICRSASSPYYIQVLRYDNGTLTQLGSDITIGYNLYPTLRCEMIGNAFNITFAGTLQTFTTTDNTYASGTVGIMAQRIGNPYNAVFNFKAGEEPPYIPPVRCGIGAGIIKPVTGIVRGQGV
jgi:hypothetical protein